MDSRLQRPVLLHPARTPCILTEFMAGGELNVAKNRTHKERLLVLADCSRGLSYLSRKGIVHRDIKPSNILTNHDETIFKVPAIVGVNH